MIELPMNKRNFYDPSPEILALLNEGNWIASYSGGKDSTSLVTWIEWLRRTRQVKVDNPTLVLSDTEVEYPFLYDISDRLMSLLRERDWTTKVVKPQLKDKLYNQIFGRGLTPVDPKHTKQLRWCTRSTKVDPMKRFGRSIGRLLMLSGVRWGESQVRDGKLKSAGCVAGGECGLPTQEQNSINVNAPIINWKTCQVVDWLQGLTSAAKHIKDLLKITNMLVEKYDVHSDKSIIDFGEAKVSSLRFGCIGCPAISNDKALESSIKNNAQYKPLRELYSLWNTLRHPSNRCIQIRTDKLSNTQKWVVGPTKMLVRKAAFERLLEIQQISGITLVNDKDITFIRQCHNNKVYPKGWSESDEMTVRPFFDISDGLIQGDD